MLGSVLDPCLYLDPKQLFYNILFIKVRSVYDKGNLDVQLLHC